MYKNILIPIDIAQTQKAREMIAVAKSQAGENTQFILLNVIDVVPGWATNYLQENMMQEHMIEAKDQLSKIAQTELLKQADIQIQCGHSYNTILEVAEKVGSDLIIIGSHNPGVSDYFLGSTAAKVVRHAKCSVHVIR